jgi:MraZ protein
VLFTGEYEHTLDAKQRIAVPAEIRARLDPEIHGAGFYLVPGPNGALWLWPERRFEEMAGALEQSLLPAEDIMEFEELLFSQAARLELDKAGRVRLPERLLTQAGLSTHITIIGVRDHLELRDPQEWAATREQKLAKQSDIMLKARRALSEQTRAEGGKTR